VVAGSSIGNEMTGGDPKLAATRRTEALGGEGESFVNVVGVGDGGVVVIVVVVGGGGGGGGVFVDGGGGAAVVVVVAVADVVVVV
jgi:hypothetical protein